MLAEGEDAAELQQGQGSFLGDRVAVQPVELVAGAKYANPVGVGVADAAGDLVCICGLELGRDLDIARLDQVALQTASGLLISRQDAGKGTYLNFFSSRAILATRIWLAML